MTEIEDVDFTGYIFFNSNLSNKSYTYYLYLWYYIEALKSSTLIHYFVCYKSTPQI